MILSMKTFLWESSVLGRQKGFHKEFYFLTHQFSGALYFYIFYLKTKQFFLHFLSVFLYLCLSDCAAKSSQTTLYMFSYHFATKEPSFQPPGVVSSLSFQLSLMVCSPFLYPPLCASHKINAICLVFLKGRIPDLSSSFSFSYLYLKQQLVICLLFYSLGWTQMDGLVTLHRFNHLTI